MPLYEYVCKECTKQSEILVRASDVSPECPECGSKQLTKLLSVIGSPVVSGAGTKRSESAEPGTCGRSQCVSGGCMFGNE